MCEFKISSLITESNNNHYILIVDSRTTFDGRRFESQSENTELYMY